MKIIAAIRHVEGGTQVLFRGQNIPDGMTAQIGLKRAHNAGCIFELRDLHHHDTHAPGWYTVPGIDEDDKEVEAAIPLGKSAADDMAGYICRVLQDVLDGIEAHGDTVGGLIKILDAGLPTITLRLIDGAGNMAEGGEKFENLLQACEASAKSEGHCAVVLTWEKEPKKGKEKK